MKMLRFITVGLVVLTLSSGTILYAASKTADIAVYFNNIVQKQGGLVSDGEAYLSLQQVTENMHGMYSWNDSTKTAKIYKPNVNIVLMDDQKRIFGSVKSTTRNTFSVFVQVDNLQTEISELKIAITNPNKDTETIETQAIDEKKKNFWFKSSDFTYKFDAAGNYPVRVYFKDKASKEWFLVSEIQINAI
ncbi:hypothetical protein D3C78_1227770 [compost metagenome]